jgi:hypothetical protein
LVILRHIPPKAGISGEESEAAELLATYRPDYFVSGHDHAFPYTSGQSWNQRLGESRLLVPGQLLSAPLPNHIKLNTESGELTWHTGQRDVDTGGRALRSSGAEVGED